MCDIGYYNTHLDASTGGECAEVGHGGDLSARGGHDLGTMSDEGGRSNYTGFTSTTDDVDDRLRPDESQFFSDDFDVRVRLESGDPGIRFCMHRTPIHHHDKRLAILDEDKCRRPQLSRGSAWAPTTNGRLHDQASQPQSAPSCTTIYDSACSQRPIK